MHICDLQIDVPSLRRILGPHEAPPLPEVENRCPSATSYYISRRDWRDYRIGILKHMDLGITVSHAPVSAVSIAYIASRGEHRFCLGRVIEHAQSICPGR